MVRRALYAVKAGFVGAVAASRNAWAAHDIGRRIEHPVLVAGRGLFHSTIVAWLIPAGTFALGLWAEFWGAGVARPLEEALRVIRTAWLSKSLRPVLDTPIDLVALAFCVLTAATVLVIYKRLSVENEQTEERALAILRSINRAPNLSVFEQYPAYWRSLMEELEPAVAEAATLSGDASRKRLARGIQGALRVVAELAASFARASSVKATYGANVMIVVKRDQSPTPFAASLVSVLRFHSPTDLGSLAGVLYLPSDLLVSNIGTGATRTIPRIALPIPDPNGSRADLVIPGAPLAVTDGSSIHDDARTLAAEWGDPFEEWIRDDLQSYFSPTGAGAAVGSFASFRLGTGEDPVGVLNIDSTSTFVLGLHEEFHHTFYALVLPMIDGLKHAVALYAKDLDVGALAAADQGAPATVAPVK